MLVNELKKILESFPEDEEITILYPEDNYGDVVIAVKVELEKTEGI